MLYQKVLQNCPGRKTVQLVIPKPCRMRALQGGHEEVEHLGFERMIDLFRD